MPMLTEDQVQSYRDNGYIVVPDVLSADEVAALRAETDSFVDRSREVAASGFDLYRVDDKRSLAALESEPIHAKVPEPDPSFPVLDPDARPAELYFYSVTAN